MTILSSAPRQAELVPILCAITNFSLDLEDVDELFDLEDGEAGLLLRGLHSLLNVPLEDEHSTFISSHHASFLDFLNNPSRSHHFYADHLDHRMAVARALLRVCASGNAVQRRSTRYHLIPFLTSLPPSPELCPLIASMDPDFIFAFSEYQFGDMLSWLKVSFDISNTPSADTHSENTQCAARLDRTVGGLCLHVLDDRLSHYLRFRVVKHIPSPSSELYQALMATLIVGMGIRTVRRLLDIKWAEFRTILCGVRPNSASNPKRVLHGFSQAVGRALVPLGMQQGS
ncbi:hypothetical protein C8R45DRAFT_1097041 [Mycena sanguinolenta]|nr:hypothetical protein C8R45DRAFT_1097041 [Mycena sanguinolenta]